MEGQINWEIIEKYREKAGITQRELGVLLGTAKVIFLNLNHAETPSRVWKRWLCAEYSDARLSTLRSNKKS